MKASAFVLLMLSCERPPPHDPAKIYGTPARACATKYVPPPEGSIEITLVVSDEARDFAIEGFCMTLDGGAVMATDSLEINVHGAIRNIAAAPGPHALGALGVWRDNDTGHYRFEVKSTHTFDLTSTMTIRATAYEPRRDVPLQDRLRIEWIEK